MASSERTQFSHRSQHTWASSEPSSPTTASPEYTNTPENQESVLKSYLMKIIDSIKEDINYSLKEIQESTGKQVEALNEETINPMRYIGKHKPTGERFV